MIATYRLQLDPNFGFAQVETRIPYFQQLGVSHLYLSPITESRAGSTHGYDVIDHNVVREELGGREGLDRLLQSVREAGLELILDFVPNHCGVGPRNEAWQHVLAYGPHSPRARFFDIDWNPLEETLQGKMLLPFLGKSYGETLDEGEIELSFHEGQFFATYYEHRFALSPCTYAVILQAALPHYERTDTYFDLKDLQEAYHSLEPSEVEKGEGLGRRLQHFSEQVSWTEPLSEFRGEVLHELLEQQYWRLAYWKTASYEINYRRFFTINDLVALRMEDEDVFWSSHRLLGDLLAQEGIAGVRIDHIDGLFDPHVYLKRLRELGARKVWVEKILAPRETLPEDWPVEGTTGYEFMNDVMKVLLQPEGILPLQRTYQRFVPEASSFEEVVHECKRLVIDTALSSELYRLAYELNRLCKADYHTRDFPLGALRGALAEVAAALDRYRTYLPYNAEPARDVLLQTIYRARQRTPAFEPAVYDFLFKVFQGKVHEDLQGDYQAWLARFQQYTAPVAAKGVEDTAFYRHLPLVALNEVGGEPELPEHPVQAFHSHARFRSLRFPLNLITTATHDHKRGEDTRMRLLVLTEVPDLWDETMRKMEEIGETHREFENPSRFDEYLFFQILVALWEGHDPATLPDRLCQYLQKASRESKRRTSWSNPDEGYEKTLEAFVRGVLADERLPNAVAPLAQVLAERGFSHSLSQVVLKLTTPGVPDFYQGCELFDHSLVDPDNRRSVDYEDRERRLKELYPLLETPELERIREMIGTQNETVKFYFTAQLLQLRNTYSELFLESDYQALDVEGTGANHWLAYLLRRDDLALLVVVPRFSSTASNEREASIPLPQELFGSFWKDVLSGKEVQGEEQLFVSDLSLPWTVLMKRASHSG